jgi:hypothetical protein
MKKVLLTIATAAALLAPATATPATSAGHGYRNPRAPQIMQAGLRTMPRQFPGVRCSWFVPGRSINCTMHKGGRTYVLWLKPYRVGATNAVRMRAGRREDAAPLTDIGDRTHRTRRCSAQAVSAPVSTRYP